MQTLCSFRIIMGNWSRVSVRLFSKPRALLAHYFQSSGGEGVINKEAVQIKMLHMKSYIDDMM